MMANVDRWEQSGEPDRWVECRGGAWGNGDESALLDELRRSSYWPVARDAVVRTLEAARQRHAAQESGTVIGQRRSRTSHPGLRDSREGKTSDLGLLDLRAVLLRVFVVRVDPAHHLVSVELE